MAEMTPDEMREFLEAPRIAHITTLRPDGSPHTSPVWYEYDDGAFYVFTSEQFAKAKHIRRDPRISISIASDDEPYRYVVADGPASFSNVSALDRASSIASRYRGEKGPAYAREVQDTYGETWIVELRPAHLVTWRNDDE